MPPAAASAHATGGLEATSEPASPFGSFARHGRRTRGLVAGLLCIAATVVACFPKTLSPDWVFFSRDIHAYWYPMVSTFVRVVGEGSLPLWDPYEGYGLPMWADPGGQVAYPPTWLNLLLLPQVVYKLVVLGHVFFAGAGAFVLARRWGLRLAAAITAGVVFASSGPLVSAGSLLHHLCGAAWLPWGLWALERLLDRGSRRDVAVLALVLGGQALAGSAEMCAMSGLAAIVRWLALAHEGWGRALRRSWPLAGATAVAASIAAVQWLPTLAILGHTNRIRFAPEARLSWSVHPATLIDVIVPRLASEMSMGPGVREILYGSREPFLLSFYVGAATFPLVLLAARSRRPQRNWVFASFVLFLAVSFGRHFPPARVLLTLPPLSLFRYPSKYLLPAALFWALLAALGLDAWWRSWSRRDRIHAVAAGVALALAAGALAVASQLVIADPRPLIALFEIPEAWREWMAVLASRKLLGSAMMLGAVAALLLLRAARPDWARVLGAAALLLVAADLTSAARPVNAPAPAALLTHVPPVVDRLKPTAGQTRLLSIGGALGDLNRDLTRGPAGWEPEWRWTLGLQEAIVAPSGTRWGLRGSYDPDFTGLASTRLLFMDTLVRQTETTPLGLRLLQMGNVGWVVDVRPEGSPLLPVVAQEMSVFSQPIRLHRVPAPFPPCYVVGAASRASSDEAAIRRIASADFDPNLEVVLAGDGPAEPAAPSFDGIAAYRRRGANRLLIETATNAPGFVVASEAFDPDWRATVDGAPATIERANVLFRAVRVSAGRHLVELVYRPASVPWGLGMALLGLVVCALLLRRASPPPRAVGGR